MPALQSDNIRWPAFVGDASSYWLFGAILFSYIALRFVQVSIHLPQSFEYDPDSCIPV
jgi:hypothetical protein